MLGNARRTIDFAMMVLEELPVCLFGCLLLQNCLGQTRMYSTINEMIYIFVFSHNRPSRAPTWFFNIGSSKRLSRPFSPARISIAKIEHTLGIRHWCTFAMIMMMKGYIKEFDFGMCMHGPRIPRQTFHANGRRKA